MEGYFKTQRSNLEQIRDFNAFADLLGSIDQLYGLSVDLVPKDHWFGRFVLICHKEFLAAASLIAQGQPLDSVPVTRRAIDAIRVATAIKENPDSAKQWLAFAERHARWLARQKGGKVPQLPTLNVPVAHPVTHALIEEYRILSDSATHFSPEYFASLDWKVQDGQLFLNYFSDARTTEQHIVYLATAHVQILQVLDFCLDGTLSKFERWVKSMEEVYRKGRVYNDQYRRRYKLNEVKERPKDANDRGDTT